ncbi:MAG TPA: hypothetical protein DCS93_35830 [Microscillaceae bacterium]|nr:hypothetical protein [Microscillaceae bacterium]
MLNILPYKKALWFALAFCLFSMSLRAQNEATTRQVPPSILKANKIARKYYRQRKIDSFFYWANQMLILAKRHHTPDYEAEATKFIGVAHLHRSQNSKALQAFEKNIPYYYKVQDHKGLAMMFNNIGLIYQNTGRYVRSIQAYKKALVFNKKIKRIYGVANIQSNLGSLYEAIGQYKVGLEYHLQALRTRQKLGDRWGIGTSYNNLGALEQQMKNYEQALQYFQKAIAIAKEVQNPIGQVIALGNVGTVNSALERYDAAENYYKQALEMSRQRKMHSSWAGNLTNLGEVAFRRKQYPEALEYYEQALAKRREIQDQKGISLVLLNMADVYWHTQHIEKAYNYAHRSYELARKLKLRKQALGALETLTRVHYQRENYKKAFDTQKEYILYKDSLLNSTKVKEIETLKTIYETERKQDSIAFLTLNLAKQKDSIRLKQTTLELLQKDKDLQAVFFEQEQQKKEVRLQKIAFEKAQQAKSFETQEKSRQQEIKFLAKKDELNTSLLQNAALQKRNLLISGGVVILLLLVAAGWLFITQRQRTRLAKEKLKRQNVISQFEYLKHQVNPHFLLNSLNALASLIQQDSKKAHTFALKFSQLYLFVLELKDNLMVSLEEELKFCEAYLALQQIRFGDSLKIDYEINTDKSQVSLPPLALQIALENAVKHNQMSEQAPLHIRIFSEAKKLVVQNNLQKKAANIVSSTHIGVQNIKERYKLIGKEQPEFIESTTDFTVKLPLSV